MPKSKWPKSIPSLTEEQQRISEDFMDYWLQVLPRRFGIIEQFNHRFPLFFLPHRNNKRIICTLDIGAGRGEHIAFENLDIQEYTALEMRAELAHGISQKYPEVRVMIGDCQKKLDISDGYFDRVLAIHVLEHLPDLPSALLEINRVMKAGGILSVLLPCEGGLLYSLARNISAKSLFEKRYKQKYDWYIRREHINKPDEILEELTKIFKISDKIFFPLFIPSVTINLVIGLTLKKIKLS